ncbi:MAG: UDP-N-acetylmuramoyl-L-alanyl-D-glutamate--2,6-diaminopimelate ligase [Acidimicrobiia bacterium]|nr:UDP-N-acetylmuramoyl-L-alanyl-D-glutamate--2,6-diaminopimelate ligase [Acidimicrobiia bacterium]
MPALLSEVAAVAPGLLSIHGEAVIDDVTHDSDAVRQGSLFVAIRGRRHDGHAFVGHAIHRGASAVLVQDDVADPVPAIVVRDTRAAMAPAARLVHGEPDRDLAIVGVTGTNGKTTVVHMCEAVWAHMGRPSGMLGTLGARHHGVPIDLGHTTPEASDLQRVLATMRDDGVEVVAMEVSSHALALHRADAIGFDAVGFTNLTQDHLDFHVDMEDYFATKQRLFDLERSPLAVVNVDDAYGRRIVASTAQDVTTVSVGGPADLVASNVQLTPAGSRFTVKAGSESAVIELPLAGVFNVSNALVAAGLLAATGVPLEAVAGGMRELDPIPGRMEVVRADRDFTVIVDYAHTPDAVTSVLSSVRELTPARVIAVLGAGGDRDQDKRSLMGAAAARYSDVTIVTTDNPRSEEPADIAAEVVHGAKASGRAEVLTVLDRADAIGRAIDLAGRGDVVMILGRGHEAGQVVGDRVIPFVDAEVAARALAQGGTR